MAFSLKDQVIFRPPGSIRGNEFVIDDCHNCDFYICDHTAQITADGCVNCRFFFGPCESSIFLRDCSNSQVVAACQQLRLRSCTDMQFSLFCGTEPVIESSARLQFGCFQFAYFSLREQMARANLSVWCNEWSRIHDFTAAGAALNWSFLDAAVASTDMLTRPLLDVGGGVFDAAELMPQARSIVPLTGGRRPLPAAFGSEPTACFVLLLGASAAAVDAAGADALEAVHATLAKGAACVRRTRLITLERAQLARLVDGAANAAALTATAAGGDGTALALELAGAGGDAEMGAALRAFGAQRTASTLCVEGADALRLAALFFEEFKPKV